MPNFTPKKINRPPTEGQKKRDRNRFKPDTWLDKAALHDATRPVLTWGRAQTVLGKRAIVTCDGYRAHIEWETAEQFADEVAFKKSLSEGQALQYPDIMKVLPRQLTTLQADPYLLIQAVKLAQPFAKGNADTLKLECSGDTLMVSAHCVEWGDVTTRVPINNPNNLCLTVCLKWQFLLDALAAWKGHDRVALHFLSATAPIIVGEYEKRAALIMPMSLDSAPAHTPKKQEKQPDEKPQPTYTVLHSSPTGDVILATA